ncbi:MAG: glycoside hydrolase family 26 protein [Thermoplasmatota archaeon]
MSLSTMDFWDEKAHVERSQIPEPLVNEINIEGDKTTISIPEDQKLIGIYHAPHSKYWDEIKVLETRLLYDFPFFMDYFNFTCQFGEAKDFIYNHYDQGHVLLLTLQPYVNSHSEEFDGQVVLLDILNGKYDQYLVEWAIGLRDLSEPIFLRFANEMNGDWTQWCSWFYGLDPDLYIMAWVRIHTIFDYIGADNVQFVWNPHDRTYPDYKWQAPPLYYPGDDMVDWIGLTAYNNGITRPTEVWRDFEECYLDLYDDYMRRYSSKPFMITEFACNEVGGSKSEWIETGLKSLFEDYPNIWMAIWWNGIDETWIYDIDSTDESLSAFRDVLSHPNVATGPVST